MTKTPQIKPLPGMSPLGATRRNGNLKKFIFMHYSDGFVIATAVWDVWQTSGPVDSQHMQALHRRAICERLPIEHCRW